MTLPAIRHLLGHRGPPEVAGPVAGFIVDPVDCVERHPARVLALRPRPYRALDVCDENAHVMPGLMDADAAPAPVLIARPVSVVAAPHHRLMEAVERVDGKAVHIVHGRWLAVRLAAGGLLGRLPGAHAGGELAPCFRLGVHGLGFFAGLRLPPRGPASGETALPVGPPAVSLLETAARLVPAGHQIRQGHRDRLAAVTQADGCAPAERLGLRAADTGVRALHHQLSESLSYLNEYPLLSPLAAHFWPSPSGNSGSDDNSRRLRTTAPTDRCSVYAASRSRSCSSSGRSTVIRFMDSMISGIAQIRSYAPQCSIPEMAP